MLTRLLTIYREIAPAPAVDIERLSTEHGRLELAEEAGHHRVVKELEAALRNHDEPGKEE